MLGDNVLKKIKPKLEVSARPPAHVLLWETTTPKVLKSRNIYKIQ